MENHGTKETNIRDALYTHTVSTYEAAELHPTAQQEQGTQDPAINLPIYAMDGLIRLILSVKEYPKLCRLNSLLEILNPSQELLCESRQV